jgi:hypothetical protein
MFRIFRCLYLASKLGNLKMRNKKQSKWYFILLINKLHGGEPFLKSQQLLSESIWSFNTVYIGAGHYSLSCASWIQSTSSHLTSLIFISILSSYLHLGLPSGLVPSGYAYRNFVRISLPSRACYKSRSPHSPWLDRPNKIWPGIQTMKLLIKQISPAPYYFLPFWSKYSIHHRVLKHFSSMKSLVF